MKYKTPIELYSVIAQAVDSLRLRGEITSVTPNGTLFDYACSNNGLKQFDYITVYGTAGAVYIDLMVEYADATKFSLSVELPAQSFVSNAPYFMHEKEAKAAAVLTEKTDQETYQYQKYPLVLLLHPYSQEQDSMDYSYKSTFKLYLLTLTESEAHSDDRYADTILPVLRPIQDGLVQALADSKYTRLSQPENLDYKWSDLLYIDGNPFPDKMDGVELEVTDLEIEDRNC